MKRLLFFIIFFLLLNINVTFSQSSDVRVLLYKNPFNVKLEGDLYLLFLNQPILTSQKINLYTSNLNCLRIRVGVFSNIFDALNYSIKLKENNLNKDIYIQINNNNFYVDIGDFSSYEERDLFKIINHEKIPLSMDVEIFGVFQILELESLKILLEDIKDGIIFEIHSNDEIVEVNNIRYRGYIYLHKNSNSYYLINKLKIDDYLKGVVPSEMPQSFNIEALKAQAVAARTYVLSRIKDKNIYDVTSTPNTQAYSGIEKESEKTNRAVDETKDEVILYNGQIIEAVYHSTSGGYTENNENVWNSTPYPYLRGVESPYEEKSPHYSWSKFFTNYRVQRIIKKYLQDNNIPDIGEVINFEIVKKGVSPRVVEIKVIGMYDELILKGTTFQSLFGLKSTWFDFEFKRYRSLYIQSFLTMVEIVPLFKGGGSYILNRLKSFEDSPYDINKKWDIVVFNGKGWGHGVGMSQWGAQGYSEIGLNYVEILKHYYTGVEIKKFSYGY